MTQLQKDRRNLERARRAFLRVVDGPSNDAEHDAAIEMAGAVADFLDSLDKAAKCCHRDALILCPHPCEWCARDQAEQVADAIRAFDRESRREEHTDTGRAWELLHAARRALSKFTNPKKGA